MKKLLTVCMLFLAALTLSAQKTIDVAVYEDVTSAKPEEHDVRTLNLLREYFKSELATHSGIELVQSQSLSLADWEILAKYGIKRGKAPEKDQIAKLCKDDKAAYCALIRIERKADKDKKSELAATVSIYNADGTLKSAVSRTFKNVQQTDIAGIMLARDTAVAIRGANPVDDVNLVRMKKSLEKLTNSKVKDSIRKNMDSVR